MSAFWRSSKQRIIGAISSLKSRPLVYANSVDDFIFVLSVESLEEEKVINFLN